MGSKPRLYVGNIPYDATEEQLRGVFSKYNIVEVKFINDRDTGRFRGFAFVEVATLEEMSDAIAQLNGVEMGERRLTINEAKEREPRGGNGGGGGRRDRDHHQRGNRRSEGQGGGRNRDGDLWSK